MNISVAELKPGQVFTYRHREQDTQSRVIILKLETLRDVPLAHIAVTDVMLAKAMQQIGHMPFDADVLTTSLVELDRDNNTPMPDYAEGYEQWRGAFDEGNAGFFTTSVADAVEFIEQALSQ